MNKLQESPAAVAGLVTGVVDGVGPSGGPIVRFEGAAGAVEARVAWMREPPDWTASVGGEVILGFESGEASKPIVLGLLGSTWERTCTVASPASETTPDVLHLRARQELILECGKAKVSLRADGRVVILGGYVLSRSRGVNKIRGASVKIN